MKTSDTAFVCPFCGPADEVPGDRRRCATCGRRCDERAARRAREAWGPGTPPAAPPTASPARGAATSDLVVVVARSPLTAVVLSFVWLGAGHLYAGRRTTGVALAVGNLLLWLASGLGAAVWAPVTVWAVAACAASVSSGRAARTAPGAVYRA